MYNFSGNTNLLKCGGRERKRSNANMQFIPTMHFWINVLVNNAGQCLAKTTQDEQLFYWVTIHQHYKKSRSNIFWQSWPMCLRSGLISVLTAGLLGQM